MDYEKAYKEALERARGHHGVAINYGKTEEIQELEHIFPELRESEDERIRKDMISYIGGLNHKEKAKWIAYLEKQKEQNPAASWTIQDAQPGDILNSVRVQATIIFKGFNPDGKHIDAYCALQKGFFIAQELPWDRDFEPATQAWKDAIFDAMVRKGYLWDADNKRLNKAVQKPAEWSEEDEHLIDEAAEMLRRYAECVQGGNSKVYIGYLADRIESLRPQPKREWTEKDEARLGNLLSFLDGRLGILPGWKADCKNWLLSRFRALSPQPHWKPSKEQMEMLSYVVEGRSDLCGDVLRSLYQDLKKLM